MEKVHKIEISSRTIIFAVFFIILLNLLWNVRELIFSLFIAFIVMSALNPLVTFFEGKKIPRALTTVAVFILLFTAVGYFIRWIAPPIIQETTVLFKNLPAIMRGLNIDTSQYMNQDFFTKYVPNITNNTLQFIRNIFSNVIFVISTVVFSFYFLIEEGAIKKFLVRFFEKQEAAQVAGIIEKAEKRMRAWLWGQLFLMIIIGTLTYIGLLIIGVKYAASLAVIAGLLEIVPILGPTLSAVPAFLIGAAQSYFLGFATIALYFIVQQLENQVVVPLVMRKAVGLNPIVTLIALIVGGRIGGFLGILLAIPLTLFIETLLVEFSKLKASEKSS